MSSRFPFPIPKGWFQVAYGDELEPGAVQPLRYFGKDLVLFRGADGRARVLDAFCPHLGAHLGHGGEVVDDTIQCPFHAWRFDGDGRCVDIPYSDKMPKRCDVGTWPVVEANGLILVYHDLEGNAPNVEIPHISEYQNDEWTPYVRRRWTIRTCNQEMAENSVDAAHFRYLHGTYNMPTTRAETDGPLLRMVSDTQMKTPGGIVEGQIQSHLYGFGFTLTRFTGLVETLLVSSATPIDEDHCDIRFSFTVKKLGGASTTEGIGKAFVAEITRQLEQDIPIWENKVYLERPALCAGDGPIGIFRQWCKQFYPQDAAAARAV